MPAPSTITASLRRQECLTEAERPSRDDQRLQAEAPNDLWQFDFLGQPELPIGMVHRLTTRDDYARFSLLMVTGLVELAEIVAAHVLTLFRRSGLPRRILLANQPPWGMAGSRGLTAPVASWRRLGIAVSQGRP
jgi:hypothetical protein